MFFISKVLFFLFLTTNLFSSENLVSRNIEEVEENNPIVDLSGIPDSMVAGCVNAITGSYCEGNIDIKIPNSLSLSRFYNSSNSSKGSLLHGWDLNLPGNSFVMRNDYEVNAIVKHGARQYQFKGYADKLSIQERQLRYGVTNCSSGMLSAKENIKNTSVQIDYYNNKFLLKISTFEHLIYKKLWHNWDETHDFFLEKHRLPNRTEYLYSYDSKFQLKGVDAQGLSGLNLGSIKFIKPDKFEKNPVISAYTPEGDRVTYKFSKMDSKDDTGIRRYCLTEFESTHSPKQNFHYMHLNGEKLILSSRPEDRFKLIEYYEKKDYTIAGQTISVESSKDSRFGRVVALYEPIGNDKTPLPLYRFVYHLDRHKITHKPIGGSTEVYDPYDHKTVYHFSDEQRLTSIQNFNKDGTLYKIEKVEWGENDTLEYTLLKKRVITDGFGTTYLSKEYKYDKRGNVLKEITSGNLKGKGKQDSHIKYYSYTEFDQICSEDDGLKQITTNYYPNTDLVKTKFVLVDSNIVERNYFEYDGNGSLILEIKDNGKKQDINDLKNVSHRFITRIQPKKEVPYGLPEVIEEKYLDLKTKEEKLILKRIISYTSHGLKTKEDVYDANDVFAYSTDRGYDLMSNLLWEKDPLGNFVEYKYDANKNCIFKKKSTDQFETHYSYDFSNRLIKESFIFLNGLILSKSYSYDLCGNKIESVDIFGNITRYEYDEFNRVIKALLPDGHTQTKNYDILNNPTVVTDANQNKTLISYNALGKPTQIIHPCGGVESHLYSLQGQLKYSTLPDLTTIHYEYDYKNRLISKKHFSATGEMLSQEAWKYDAFYLLEEINSAGIKTHYFYDDAGKLIILKSEDSEIIYSYDSLGRKKEILQKYENGKYKKTLYSYDLLNRVIEEKILDEEKLLGQTQNCYDGNGNIAETILHTSNGCVRKKLEYNCFNEPSKITSPNGGITYYHQEYTNFKREEEIDPKGNITSRTYNYLGKLILEEFKTSFGEVERRVSFLYDGVGNLTNRFEGDVETCFKYDSRNREIAIVEANQKVTLKEYDAMGNITCVIKPDGNRIFYKYDGLRRVLEQFDDINSIHYQLTYDTFGNIISVRNLVTNLTTNREYDGKNRLIRETLENGLTLKYTYDCLDRIQKTTFHDGSSITCKYDAKNLINLKRQGKNSYEFEYLYDLSGRMKEISLPFNRGKINYSYDNANRLTTLVSPYYSQHIPEKGYDLCDLLIQYESRDSQGKHEFNYSYDSLYQLTQENENSYSYDDRFNRTTINGIYCENNSLNQTSSQGDLTYLYDLNGNMESSYGFSYRYDALDRLVEAKSQTETITFSYDFFHRRMKKDVNGLTEKYLYISDTEVGATDENNNIKELKIVGPGSSSLKNSAAIEINDEVYLPIHDHRGNPCSLIDINGNLIESYKFTAFGLENSLINPLNPWRFSGKRVDFETGFIYFGRRYYDPQLGKWISPDPIWFEDGTNLYAYVHNSPIVFVDPNGLMMDGLIPNIPFYHYDATANRLSNSFPFQAKETFPNVIPIGEKKIPGVIITLTNGINTSEDEAIEHARYLSNMLDNTQVNLYYNPTHSALFDTVECILNTGGIDTGIIFKLREDMSKYLEENPNDIWIPVCHSHGCIQVRNTLQGLDRKYAEKVYPVAVAPGGFIKKKFCGDVLHLVCEGDWIPKLNYLYMKLFAEDTTIHLPRHPDCKPDDEHSFQNITYRKSIIERVYLNIDKYGSKNVL